MDGKRDDFQPLLGTLIHVKAKDGAAIMDRLELEFQRHDRDVEVLTYVLVMLLLIVVARSMFLIYGGQFEALWALFGPTTPLIAALLVTRVANRVIANTKLVREDDRRQDIVRTTHHLIAITKDLKAQVVFVKKIMEEGAPTIALSQIAKSIEDRYAALLDREIYKFLPGPCIDIITRMSGSIWGIAMVAAGVQQLISSNPAVSLLSIPNSGFVPAEQLEELISDTQKLIDGLFALRQSIDSTSGHRKLSTSR